MSKNSCAIRIEPNTREWADATPTNTLESVCNRKDPKSDEIIIAHYVPSSIAQGYKYFRVSDKEVALCYVSGDFVDEIMPGKYKFSTRESIELIFVSNVSRSLVYGISYTRGVMAIDHRDNADKNIGFSGQIIFQISSPVRFVDYFSDILYSDEIMHTGHLRDKIRASVINAAKEIFSQKTIKDIQKMGAKQLTSMFRPKMQDLLKMGISLQSISITSRIKVAP